MRNPQSKSKRTLRLLTETLEPRRVLAANLLSADAYWVSHESLPSGRDAESVSYLQLNDYSPLSLDVGNLRRILSEAPMEFTAEAWEQPFHFGLPTPDGGVEMFEVVESPIMEPGLAAQFPEIKTYAGISLDNSGSRVRFDVTPQGFHAQVRTRDGSGGYYVDPYYHLEDEIHVSYYRSDAVPRDVEFEEKVFDLEGNLTYSQNSEATDVPEGFHVHADGTIHANADHSHDPDDDKCCCPDCLDQRDVEKDDVGEPRIPRTGSELRTYRTAVAATGEYTNFHGGTVASGQAAIVTMMNRVSGVYEDELTVRMVLVANNSNIVYTNPGSDPFPNNISLGTIQSVIDSNIGNTNYDLGHLVDTGGGGFASLGVIGLTGQKARGYTGLTPPNNDPFWIDYVAHEMGHQYGGSHTFNGDSGSCSGGNRSGSSAYEPGSGSTIMAYAGICGNDNLQNNSDPYFHSRSLDQIVNLLEGRPNVGTFTDTGNEIPTADAGPDYTIPQMTPFILTGSGTDADGDTLFYNWEQRDLGPQQDVNSGDNGSSPIFRSWEATTNPQRTLPRLQNLINNNTVRGETLPTTNRILDFRLTVRDNKINGGAVATDNMRASVTTAAGPFLVQSPNTSSVVWEQGQTQTVTWDVAGTNANGVNTSQVNILLSTNGGTTYPITLASNVSNDGSHDITVPSGVETDDARVKIEAVGNIFFDISNADFSITPPSDQVAPEAMLTVFDVTTPGGASNDIFVTYTDDVAVDFSDIGTFDIEVMAPDGSTVSPFLISVSAFTDTSPITATYGYNAPGGTWDAADEGTYEITMVNGEVTDTNENPVAAGLLGTFEVDFGMSVDGDFDDDGDHDCDDINMLTTEVAAGTNAMSFDLTGDGFVNQDDTAEWLSIAGAINLASGNPYLEGDANLDGLVDGNDFITWNENKFGSSTNWCDGNFDGNDVVDGLDFIIWNGNRFMSSDSVLIVPNQREEVALAVQSNSVVNEAVAPVVVDLPDGLRTPSYVPRETAVEVHRSQRLVEWSTPTELEDEETVALDRVLAEWLG